VPRPVRLTRRFAIWVGNRQRPTAAGSQLVGQSSGEANPLAGSASKSLLSETFATVNWLYNPAQNLNWLYYPAEVTIYTASSKKVTRYTARIRWDPVGIGWAVCVNRGVRLVG
jgi:hypothetical protein